MSERLNPFPDKKVRELDYERTTEFLKEAQEIGSAFEIGQERATWIPQTEYPTLPLVLLLGSDFHYGSIHTDYDLLHRHLDIVKDTPNFFLATNGDHVDNFKPAKFPSGMIENPLPPQFQARAFVRELLSMDKKGKLAIIGHGNHDDFGFDIAGQDFYESFMDEFMCPIFTKGGILTVQTNGAMYRMVQNHTYWGRSKINITNAAKRILEYEGSGTCDIGWLGHTHQSSYEHFTKGEQELIAVVSGSYKVKDPYAAKRGISIKRAGHPGIALMLWQNHKHIEIFKDIEIARHYTKGMVFEEERRLGNVIVIEKTSGRKRE